MKFSILTLSLLLVGGLTVSQAAEPSASATPSATPTPAASPAASPAATPSPQPSAAPSPSVKSDGKRTQLYAGLDFDEDAGLFVVLGTKTPFSGPVISNYDNGVTEQIGELTDGERTGWWVEYAENGQKTSEGLRVKDMEDGLWTYWSENGQLQAQGAYKNGSAVGKWVTYFESSGKPDSSGEYKDGLMNGPWVYHDEKTGEERTIQFDMGVQLKK